MRADAPALFGRLDDRDKRHEEDLEVKAERPVLDVVVVELDAIGNRRLPPQALDLRQAGDSGPDAVALGVAGKARLEHLHVLGALGSRADEAHVPTGDVEELWKLVQRCPPPPPADPGAPVAPLDPAGRLAGDRNERGRRRLLAHRAEFQDIEWPVVATDAALA